MALTDANGARPTNGGRSHAPREARAAAAAREAFASSECWPRQPVRVTNYEHGRAGVGHFTSERRTLRSAEAALPASGSAAASEFEVVERCIDVAARAQFLGVLGGDRRTVRAIVDFREQLDRLLVRAVARGARAERVVSGAHHAERVRALNAAHRERLLRLLGEFEGVLGAAVRKCDAREDD